MSEENKKNLNAKGEKAVDAAKKAEKKVTETAKATKKGAETKVASAKKSVDGKVTEVKASAKKTESKVTETAKATKKDASATVKKLKKEPEDEFVSAKSFNSDKKKSRKKTSNTGIVGIILIIAIVAVVIFVASWLISKAQAHATVVSALEKLKAGDKQTEEELIDLKTTLDLEEDEVSDPIDIDEEFPDNATEGDGSEESEQGEENDEDEDRTISMNDTKTTEEDYIDFFKSMSYKIKNEKADFVDGYVTVEITNKNIGEVIEKYFMKSFELAIQSGFSTLESSYVQEKLDQYLEELLTDESTQSLTTEVTFKLKREGFKWVLDVNKEELCDAILPGLRDELANLKSSFGYLYDDNYKLNVFNEEDVVDAESTESAE